MLGVTIDTPACRAVERAGHGPLHGGHAMRSAPRLEQAALVADVIVRVLGVAGQAGGVGHRDESLRVAGLAIAAKVLVRDAERAGRPGLVGVEAIGAPRLFLHRQRLVADIAVDREGQERDQHQDRKAPRRHPLSGQQALEREDRADVLVFGGIRNRFDTANREGRQAAFAVARNRDAVAAENQLRAHGRVKRGSRRAAPVDLERLFPDRGDGQRAVGLCGDPGMARIDGKIGQVDATGRIAPDGQFIAFDRRWPDNLFAAGLERDLLDKKAHRSLTSRRRR